MGHKTTSDVIAMKVLNFSVGSIINPLLEMLLAHNGLTGSQRYLILHPDEARGGIVINSSTQITATRAFSTVTGGKPTRGPTDKLAS